ncbi:MULTISPECIES: YfgG family protein [Pantoea]|uniref:YfgG family protein n=1 Tax=Pantoea TaxID=53335 RepID=UPI0028933F0A|nr:MULTISPECIES: YfgG family protein [unclassified Pantoea]MCG7388930.1 YfgG family protein [Pantoea sp. ACRSB]
MNSAIPSRRRPKSGSFTRIVLLISFIILVSRLIFILPAAFEHHQQKKAAPQSAPLSTAIRDNT